MGQYTEVNIETPFLFNGKPAIPIKCVIGEICYKSLAEGLNALKSGQTLLITDDIEGEEEVTSFSGLNNIIDLNGHKLHLNENFSITNSKIDFRDNSSSTKGRIFANNLDITNESIIRLNCIMQKEKGKPITVTNNSKLIFEKGTIDF